jgi:hypothetical protein
VHPGVTTSSSRSLVIRSSPSNVLASRALDVLDLPRELVSCAATRTLAASLTARVSRSIARARPRPTPPEA